MKDPCHTCRKSNTGSTEESLSPFEAIKRWIVASLRGNKMLEPHKGSLPPLDTIKVLDPHERSLLPLEAIKTPNPQERSLSPFKAIKCWILVKDP